MRLFLNTVLFFLIIGFAPYASKGQNLISNGSFELATSDCTVNSTVTVVNGWNSPNVYYWNSPDYYTATCSVTPYTLSTPTNCVGYQVPKDGGAYFGMQLYSSLGNGDSEYLLYKLSNKLKSNYIYCFSMYVNLADDCKYSVNNIGVLFSNQKPDTVSGMFYVSAIPQIETNSFITDRQNWTQISDTFIANGTEQYMTIGRFAPFNSSNVQFIGTSTPTTFPPGFAEAAYYYIDSVSLYACDSIVTPIPPTDSGGVINFPNTFTPNEDGKNDTWHVQIKGATDVHFNVFNRWGNLMYSNTPTTLTYIMWDGRTTSGEKCADGTYYYILEYTDQKGAHQKKNGYIALFR